MAVVFRDIDGADAATVLRLTQVSIAAFGNGTVRPRRSEANRGRPQAPFGLTYAL